MLQGEILLIIFGEIQGLGLAGDALERIIAEPEALAVHRLDALPGAQDLFIVEFGAPGAVAAGGFHLFSEKHVRYLVCVFYDYTPTVRRFPDLFFFFIR